MNKELKIEAPEGYEIDRENSTFELIKFKKIRKKFPSSWEELLRIRGWCVNMESIIISDGGPTNNRNKKVFATEEQAKASLALAQLSQLKKAYREREGGEIDWEKHTSKYIITFTSDKIIKDVGFIHPSFFAFAKAETRDLFFANFRDLIEQVSPFMVGE